MKFLKFYLLMALAAFGITATTTTLAAKKVGAKTITVKVYVARKSSRGIGIIGVGFSVDKQGHGSAGSSTTKKGPAGKRYSFGIKSAYYGDVSCGKRVLKQNSTVVLYWNNKTKRCTNKVFSK